MRAEARNENGTRRGCRFRDDDEETDLMEAIQCDRSTMEAGSHE
jgi:hypothetical protein